MPKTLIIIIFYNNFEIFKVILERIQLIGPMENILVVNNSKLISSTTIKTSLLKMNFEFIKVIDNAKKFNPMRFIDPSYDHWKGIYRAQRYMTGAQGKFDRIMMIDPDLYIHKDNFFYSIENAYQSVLPRQNFIASTWSFTKPRKHYRTASAHFFYSDQNTFERANFAPSVFKRFLSIFLATIAPSFFRPLAYDPGWRISLKNNTLFFIPAVNKSLVKELSLKFNKWSEGFLTDNKFRLNRQRLFNQAGLMLLKEKYFLIILDIPEKLSSEKIDLLMSPDGQIWFIHGRVSQNSSIDISIFSNLSSLSSV